MIISRTVLLWVAWASVLACPWATSVIEAQSTKPAAPDPLDRALTFLASQQNPDGSFDTTGPKTAITALSLMSFLSTGHTPDTGKYSPLVRHAVDYLLKSIPEDGYVGRPDGSRMYGQGIVTLALAEVYGVETTQDRRLRLRGALTKTMKVILDAQNAKKLEPHTGGWRYEPQSPDSDLSLSAWNALALRACRDIGLDTPRDSIDRAIAYILKCYRPQQHGFAYQPGDDASPSMTAVGLLSLYLLERSVRPEMLEGARFLVDHPLTDQTRYASYAHYYVTQAAHHDPTIWPAIWKRTHEALLEKQSEDGSWPPGHPGDEPGRIYTTAMAVLTLSVPQSLLPVYQH